MFWKCNHCFQILPEVWRFLLGLVTILKKKKRERGRKRFTVAKSKASLQGNDPGTTTHRITQKYITFILNIFARCAYWLKFSISSQEMKESLEWQVWCKFYQNFEDPKICSCIWWKCALGLPTFKQSQSYCPWYFSNKLIETLNWSGRTSVLQKRDAF